VAIIVDDFGYNGKLLERFAQEFLQKLLLLFFPIFLTPEKPVKLLPNMVIPF